MTVQWSGQKRDGQWDKTRVREGGLREAWMTRKGRDEESRLPIPVPSHPRFDSFGVFKVDFYGFGPGSEWNQ